MASNVRRLVLVLGLMLGMSAVAGAQGGPAQFGPRLGYNFDVEEFSIGAHLIKPLTQAIAFYPSVDYHLVESGTFLGFNADLRYQVPSADMQWLYLGAGLGITTASNDGNTNTDAGLNLIGGFQPASGSRIRPFAEARLMIGDGSSFAIFGGLNIPLGR